MGKVLVFNSQIKLCHIHAWDRVKQMRGRRAGAVWGSLTLLNEVNGCGLSKGEWGGRREEGRGRREKNQI